MSARDLSAGAAGAARAASPDDAVLGVVPRRVVEPATVEEAAEVIAGCARDGERLCFVGGGTELGLGAAPERLDVVLRTRALARVVEHAPLDQIVTVECGARLADLQAVLAGHGQMLALDPPWPDRATIGGIVATGAFGPRRARYGAVRDLIIGASFVRADGVLVRAGGKVVKNVAGFDLPKLLVGSLGTLGLVATATFRLHPRPEASATVVFARLDGAGVRQVVAAMREAQLEPEAAAELADPGGADRAARLGVRFAGFERAVGAQRDRLVAAGAKLGLAADAETEAGASFWTAHDAARAAPAAVRLKMAVLPAEPARADVLGRLRGSLRDGRSVFYPTLGLGFVAGDLAVEADASAAVIAAVAEARASIAPAGGTIVVHEAPPSVRAELDVWGVSPSMRSALPLMRSVKARLDPERRLAPGRFVGGI